MEHKNNEIAINIEKEGDKELLKTQNSNNAITSNDSEDNKNVKIGNSNIFQQLLIPKVYWIAVVSFSIVNCITFFFKREKFDDKKVGKHITAESYPIGGLDKEANRQKMRKEALIPIVYYCLLAPFVEEFLFRWLIFGLINRSGQKVKKSNKFFGILIIAFGIILSSILFSFGHFYMYGENLYIDIIYFRKYFDVKYFIIGLIFALIYCIYDYIFINIFGQMIFNIKQTLHILYMFSIDCYDSCAVTEVFLFFFVAGFNIIVVLVALMRVMYKSRNSVRAFSP